MKSNIIAIIIALLLIGGIFVIANKNPQGGSSPVNNVSIVDGKQIITLRAKSGYQPSKSIAQAGLPTVIRFDTNGTFDCSSSVRIPSLNITRALPQTGTTDIDIGTPESTVLQGTCGMGMYPFEIDFQK